MFLLIARLMITAEGVISRGGLGEKTELLAKM
jgi:hypothetical protein